MQDLHLGPRRGQRIYGDACETSIIVGNRVDMFNLNAVFLGSVTFEKLGMWARQRTPIVAYTTNDTRVQRSLAQRVIFALA